MLLAKAYGGSPAEWHTVTDTPPITINSDGTNATVSLKGNEQHTGTPSPDNPIMPQGCGDMTENLASTEQGGVNSSDGSDRAYESRLAQIRSQYIPCSAETIYMVACTEYPVQNYVSFYDANKAYLSRTSGVPITQARQFTTPVDSAYMRITMFHAIDGQIYPYIVGAKIMLNLGSTALPYEPFGYKIPISSANTTTPVYLGEVETTRKIRKLVLTGEENVTMPATSSFQIFGVIQWGDINGFCTHYPQITWKEVTTENGFAMRASSDGADRFRICDLSITTVADFKSYLQQQYAAGTPVTVWYVLATPETAVVNEPLMKIGDYADTLSMEQAGVSIPTLNKPNNTVIDVETTLKPSEMYVKYNG